LYFDFDVLMTNPPFAGTIKRNEVRDVLRHYKLMEKNGKITNRTGRHILFLERSLQFISPGGRMAIVLPQGLLNNTNAEYIRRFVIDEARILAVVGLHVNTFKPHTGTKTSVLFLQKYIDEERYRIQEIKVKYDGGWEDFIGQLRDTYKNMGWDSEVDEEQLSEELKSFIETYFGIGGEFLEDEAVEEAKGEESAEIETKGANSLKALIDELQQWEGALKEKESETPPSPEEKKATQKEVRTITNKIKKLQWGICERTLGGQVYLVLNEDKITEQFKRFWLEGKILTEMDYPIFFAVNQEPVKDNSGEYRYKRGLNGEPLLDEHGHAVIDHDLDEIAEAFIKFAKEHDYDFWRG